MWPLLRKELLQVRRSRGALISGTLLPLLLMIVMPMMQLGSLRTLPDQSLRLNGGTGPLPADFTRPDHVLTRFLLPLLIAVTGLIAPSVAAAYTVVAEHERRTLDLLVALPVRVGDVLLAKLLAVLALSACVVVPLFVVDAAAVLWLGLAGPLDVAELALVLLAAMVCSLGESLLLALLARDLRTTNNLNGALLAPITLAIVAILLVAPAPARLPAVAGMLLLAATFAFATAWRFLSFERYLS